MKPLPKSPRPYEIFSFRVRRDMLMLLRIGALSGPRRVIGRVVGRRDPV
jgi:hypothetical protein